MRQGLLGIFQLGILILNMGTDEQSLHGPAKHFSESHAAVEHVNLTLGLVLQARLKEKLLVSLLNWELFDAFTKEKFRAEYVEVQVVDDAVSTHRVVAKAKRRLTTHLKDLE